jgi:hypothetical protein
VIGASSKFLEKRQSKKWNITPPAHKFEDTNELKPIIKKSERETANKELDELKSVGRVSSFKIKLQDVEKDITETGSDGPIDAINKIVESLSIEDQKMETITEEQNDIEKNCEIKCETTCDKCNTKEEETIDVDLDDYDSKLDEECKHFLDGIEDGIEDDEEKQDEL